MFFFNYNYDYTIKKCSFVSYSICVIDKALSTIKLGVIKLMILNNLKLLYFINQNLQILNWKKQKIHKCCKLFKV